MLQEFEKWHGCRNDFIVTRLNRTDTIELDALGKKSALLCSRIGDGIGADGMLILIRDHPRVLPNKLVIINSDGSRARTCGNGIRCAALSILREVSLKSDELPEAIELELDDGSKSLCRFHGRAKGVTTFDHGTWPYVEVAMGQARVDKECSWFADAEKEVARVNALFPNAQLAGDWSAVDIGNRHLVFFLEKADAELVRKVGPAFQKSAFWDGINVHLAVERPLDQGALQRFTKILGSPIDASLEVFVWERGAGETQACGSGACSVVASLLRKGWNDRKLWHSILMPGGHLFTKEQEANDTVFLCGPGELTFTGTFVL